MTRAVAERAGTALAPVPVEVLRPPGRYVAGEESALVSWVNRGPGAPSWRPDKSRPLTIGRGAALVHNAETLAHMALIARYGPASFRARGTADAPGTSLVTVSGGVELPGVYEVAMGTTLGDIVRQARPTDEVAAVLTGGFGGAWVPAGALDTPYTPAAMAAVGGVVGAGVLVVLTAARMRRRRDGAPGAVHGGRERRTVRTLCLRPPGRRRRSRVPGLRRRRPRGGGAPTRCGSPLWRDGERVVTPTAWPAWFAARCRCSPPTSPRTPPNAPACPATLRLPPFVHRREERHAT